MRISVLDHHCLIRLFVLARAQRAFDFLIHIPGMNMCVWCCCTKQTMPMLIVVSAVHFAFTKLIQIIQNIRISHQSSIPSTKNIFQLNIHTHYKYTHKQAHTHSLSFIPFFCLPMKVCCNFDSFLLLYLVSFLFLLYIFINSCWMTTTMDFREKWNIKK